ncbi:hypothetical protein [Gelria sp. Kuro-4]|uniref:phage adaptor protein n=1 Tax=Gelria sp. Kuro-4 TaxID=2796927 RepID=UPI001BEDEDA1|nr:hypothetical protein [Gelria sp. Kuro-4]BCV23299.1 hypothetical protein kuro4_00720 [Gelria sp. Kuro-4]
MQLSELIQAVRDEVQDQAAQRWSDATIIRYLNDAQLDLAQVSKQLTSWTTQVQAGAVYAPRPPDLLIPKAFWFEIGTWRYPLEMKYGLPPENQVVQGDPEAVHLVGDYMYFYPVVQQPGTLYISGTMRPTPMALNTDVPSIQDADSLLITYAAWMCFLSDGDPIASTKESWYRQRKLEWAILDAQKHPMPDRIERNWWW